MKNYNDQETYIGDGVYASCDGFHIWLTTQQGNEIALEPEVYFALVRYATKLWNLDGTASSTTETDYASADKEQK